MNLLLYPKITSKETSFARVQSAMVKNKEDDTSPKSSRAPREHSEWMNFQLNLQGKTC